MFNKQHKLLKQLQDVQARIKNCKATIATLEPPAPDSIKLEANIIRWLQALATDSKPKVDVLFEMRFNGFEDATCDYLYKLGEYFLNVSDYYSKSKQYRSEFKKLQDEEHHLKERLGID